MTSAILDTNVLVQAAISTPRSASVRTLRAHDADRYVLITSPGAIDELLEVLALPQIRARHGWSDDEVLRFTLSLLTDADIYPDRPLVSAAIPRDITDTRFLSLAEISGVEAISCFL